MKNINKTLQNLGLNEAEADVYLYLLNSGPSLGRQIFEDLNFEKAATYDVLKTLISKELVYAVGKQRYQKFIAVAPDKLLEIVDEKQSSLSKTKSDIENLMDSLTEYAKTMYAKKNIEIIEGEYGFEKWMEARLQAKNGSMIREISSNSHQASFIKDPEKFKEMSLRFPVERIARNIHIRALMHKQDIDDFEYMRSVETTDPEMLKEVRLLPDTFEINAGFQTYNNKVSFMREYQGDFLGVIIEDKFICSLLNNMFDLIFENSKQI